MNYLSISALLNLLIYSVLAVIALRRGLKRSPLIQSFFWYCIVIATWSVGYFCWQLSSDPNQALIWTKFNLAISALIPVAYLALVLALVHKQIKTLPMWLASLAMAIFIVINFSTNLLISSVKPIENLGIWPQAGSLFPLYLAAWSVIAVGAMIVLIFAYLHEKSLRRVQFGIVLIGNLVGFMAGATNYPLWFGNDFPPVGNFLVGIFGIAVAYAVLTANLFNMRSVLRRAFIYITLTSLVLLAMTILLLLTNRLIEIAPGLSDYSSFLSILQVVLIAITIPALKQRLTTLAEARLFLAERRDRIALAKLSEVLLTNNSLVGVLTTCMQTVSERLNGSFALCYTLGKNDDDNYQVKQVVPFQYAAEVPPILTDNPLILAYLAQQVTPLQKTALLEEIQQEKELITGNGKNKPDPEEISKHATKVALAEVLVHLDCDIILPLRVKDQPFALIALSTQIPNRTLSDDEISFILSATAETVISIQRANYFEGDQQKTEFISIASHELRTPLTAIRGYLSMIIDEKLTGTELDKESWSYLEKSSLLTRDLITMVNDLLTLSRLESGRTKLEPIQIDLLPVLTEVIQKQQAAADAKKVTIELTNKRDLPHAWADPEGLKLVLTNLLTNAITYNHEGGRVTISLHASPSEGLLSIIMADTGIGMTEDQMAHLFEKFYRVDAPETEKVAGTGLGLNITKTYVEHMQGSISAQSHPHKGSTFTINLPLFTPEKLKPVGQVSAQANQAALPDQPQDVVPIGLILLSPKLSGDPYSPRDLELLDAIGNQAITTIQRAKLYEGDQMKTQFVSIASHELLTPISAVEGYIHLVLEQKKEQMNPKTLEFMQNIHSAISRLSTLVKDLLSVSRLESGRISINPEPFDISKSVHETLVQLEFVAKEKEIELKLEPLPAKLPQIFADPERTTQVLMNLIGNAIKYNRAKGAVKIAVSAPSEQAVVQIAISDNGIGMTKEQMSHLFEKFYRVDSSETTGIVGTGLGLYITKSIIEKMGGTLTVTSIKDKGSTFSFTLPVAPSPTSV